MFSFIKLCDIWVHFSNATITIPLKPILPGKPRDYAYKSLMSGVLHKPPPAYSLRPCFSLPGTTWANHWWCLLGCSAVLSYSASTLSSVLIAQSSRTCNPINGLPKQNTWEVCNNQSILDFSQQERFLFTLLVYNISHICMYIYKYM